MKVNFKHFLMFSTYFSAYFDVPLPWSSDGAKISQLCVVVAFLLLSGRILR